MSKLTPALKVKKKKELKTLERQLATLSFADAEDSVYFRRRINELREELGIVF